MIRANHRQLLPNLAAPVSGGEYMHGQNVLTGGSEVILTTAVSVIDLPFTLTRFGVSDDALSFGVLGSVTWPGSGSWRRLPDQFIQLMFADAITLNISLTQGFAAISGGGVFRFGSSLVQSPGSSAAVAPPLSILAPEYEAVWEGEPVPSNQIGGIRFSAADFGSFDDDDRVFSANFNFNFFTSASKFHRGLSAVYSVPDNEWAMPLSLNGATSWERNRNTPEGDEDPPPLEGNSSTISQFASGTLHQSTIFGGGTYSTILTAGAIGPISPTTMSLSFTAEPFENRPLF